MLQAFFPHDEHPAHFKSLDGLRGLAVFFVMLSHASIAGLMFAPWLDFSKMGKPGVYLFFVLSAYLLDRQIALALRRDKATSHYWKNYFLRRFLRIYPLFVIALLVFFAATLAGSETVIDKPQDLLTHLLMLKGESIFWSIPTEFKYYFLSPLIMLFCHHVLKWKPVRTLVALGGLIIAAIAGQYWFSFGDVSTFRYLPIFLTGTLISIFELLYEPKTDKHQKLKWTLDFAAIISFIAIVLTTPALSRYLFGASLDVHSFLLYLPYALLWGVVLIAAKHGHGFVARLLEFKPLRLIGTVSYSLYLFHMVVLGVVKLKQLPLPDGLRIYLFFVLSIGVAIVSFLLVEKPLSRIRIAPPIEGVAATKSKPVPTT